MIDLECKRKLEEAHTPFPTEAGPRPEQRSCRACGFRFINSAHGDCCSARCAQYLAEGNPTKAEQERLDNPFFDRRRFGPVGVYTNCRSCGHRFESRGLKLCAGCANGGVVERRDRATAAVKTAPCPVCGGDVPAFNEKGSKNRSGYCSRSCGNRAYYRRAERAATPQRGVFSGAKLAAATLVAPEAFADVRRAAGPSATGTER